MMHLLKVKIKMPCFFFLFFFQPPPVITDKQLDEREHTVEEWKGGKHPRFAFLL